VPHPKSTDHCGPNEHPNRSHHLLPQKQAWLPMVQRWRLWILFQPDRCHLKPWTQFNLTLQGV
jgi:hypothetical protein